MRLRHRVTAFVALMALSACLGTTGNTLVHFPAAVAGPENATAGSPLAFDSEAGWHIVLTRAILHVGALYLVQTLPASGGGAAPCVLTGTYVAEATTTQPTNAATTVAGIDVDLLSPTPQPFPGEGQGTDLEAASGQVWLTGGDIDETTDPTPILRLTGTATQGGVPFPFTATLTISDNRVIAPSDSSVPGSNPICKQRVVSPIPVDLIPSNHGGLLLRVDPRLLFVSVDFSKLAPTSANPPQYQFADASSDAASTNLYSNLRSAGALYTFSWVSSL